MGEQTFRPTPTLRHRLTLLQQLFRMLHVMAEVDP